MAGAEAATDGVPRTTGLLSRLAVAHAERSGLDVGPLLARAHLSAARLEDPRTWLSAHDQQRLVDGIADALGDDLLGFHLAEAVELRRLGLLYYVPASADTLLEALRRVVRYAGLGNEALQLSCEVRERIVLTLRFAGLGRRTDRHHPEGWMTAIVRLLRELTGRRFPVDRVRFVHRRPVTPAPLAALFAGEVEFGAPVDDLAIPLALAGAPVRSADPFLHELLVRHCEEALAYRRPGAVPFRTRAENAIVPLLPHGEARTETVAARLGVSRRTLARRLAAEGASFEEVLDRLRRDLAGRYLEDPARSVSEVAWLLGYREASAFSRAHRRWTGTTPSAARRRRDRR